MMWGPLCDEGSAWSCDVHAGAWSVQVWGGGSFTPPVTGLRPEEFDGARTVRVRDQPVEVREDRSGRPPFPCWPGGTGTPPRAPRRRATVEHILARLKDWQIYRQYRRKGRAIDDALHAVAYLYNLRRELRVNY